MPKYFVGLTRPNKALLLVYTEGPLACFQSVLSFMLSHDPADESLTSLVDGMDANSDLIMATHVQ